MHIIASQFVIINTPLYYINKGHEIPLPHNTELYFSLCAWVN